MTKERLSPKDWSHNLFLIQGVLLEECGWEEV